MEEKLTLCIEQILFELKEKEDIITSLGWGLSFHLLWLISNIIQEFSTYNDHVDEDFISSDVDDSTSSNNEQEFTSSISDHEDSFSSFSNNKNDNSIDPIYFTYVATNSSSTTLYGDLDDYE